MRLLSRDDLTVGMRFLAALPRFLRTPLSIGEMRAIVRDRFARREARFLARFAEACSLPGSPYARLMDHAGCTVEDVAASVRRDGVEGALATLHAAGVHLAGDEFKGRRPVVRGSLAFTVDPATLVNPRSVVHGLSESSGSRGARTPVPIDLAFVRDHAVNTHLALEAHGGRDWTHAHHGFPGGTSVTNPLEFAKGGRPPARWFTPIDIGSPELSPRYRWGVRAMRFGSLISGVPLPGPTVATFDDPSPVVRWMADELARGRTPHLWGYASTAVLICQAAMEAGVDLRGARFTMGGEPTTAARRAVVEAAGAIALPRMGTTETDILTFACAHPQAADDMHFLDDRHALIQPGPGRGRPGIPDDAMLVTSLLDTAPLLLVNVCMGDRATLVRRDCGCGLARDGWGLHLHDVRSFEKLTAGGITFLDVDVIRVLEEVLPMRFGGRPADWQLVERLDGDRARPEVVLFVDPSVGVLDEHAVADALLEAIGGGTGGERLMELHWREARMLRVVRESPRRTASGKILHLHLDKQGEIPMSDRDAG
ncbi:MAG: hypothetical protein IPI87_02450 [Betaproteobacteria bacterium]|nr:hypothetical protein [Betaproteobacteria bacterium]